jgi:hypothetical protein
MLTFLVTRKLCTKLYNALPPNVKILAHYIKVFKSVLKDNFLANSFYSAIFLKEKCICSANINYLIF